MVLATALVLGITTFASTLGATLSGIAAGFPLLSTLLAVFAYRSDGPGAAISVYRGLLLGLFALMGFSITLALVLRHLSTAAAFGLALLVTLTIQLGSLQAVRRGRLEPA
jgi:cadmium resistance protein CadD (predicted permease)